MDSYETQDLKTEQESTKPEELTPLLCGTFKHVQSTTKNLRNSMLKVIKGSRLN